jgi:hypothetical protein
MKSQSEVSHKDNGTTEGKGQIAVAIAMPSPHSLATSSLAHISPSAQDDRGDSITRKPENGFEVLTDEFGRVVYTIGLAEISWHYDDFS